MVACVSSFLAAVRYSSLSTSRDFIKSFILGVATEVWTSDCQVNGTGDKNCLLGRTIRASPLRAGLKKRYIPEQRYTRIIYPHSIDSSATDWIDFRTSHFASTTTKLPLGGASPS
jgi:hypothetical protein